MATDSPTERTEVSISEEIGPSDDSLDNTLKPHNESCEESESNTTIHGFNISNITVIERQIVDQDDHTKIGPQCEGSDSGVEVVETLDVCALKRNLSSNSATSQDLDINCTQSCNSSIISCCSNYDEAYNLLVRKNSTLLEDYRRHGDVTSENGSESSSISGSQLRSTRRTSFNGAKKKVTTTEPRAKPTTKDRSRSKPPVNPRASTGPTRLKSVDRSQLKPSQSTKPSGTKNKNAPTSLDLAGGSKKDTRKASSATVRTSSNSRTASTTPSDDGRWPSVNSKPAPLMSRSLKGSLDSPKQKLSQLDAKTIEKYATLPRQKKEKVADSVRDQKKSRSRENTLHRIALTKKSSRDINPTPSKTTNSLLLPKSKAKTKIYHESSIQTVLTMSDVENALTGATVSPKTPLDLEKCDMYVQVELSDPEVEKLQRMLGQLNDKFESLQVEHLKQTEKLKETESKLTDVTIEKEGLRKELENNTQRVLAILGDTDPDNASSDSLMVLESKFQNVGQVVVQQEEEISRLNMLCRSLQMDLERHLSAQRILQRQHEDLEMESMELQDFMQAEKMTLHDALKESEIEIQRQKTVIKQKEKEVAEQQEEYRQLVTLSEQQRLENINLQSRLGVLESKSRELLVQQGSTVSGAAVALSSLIGRLDGLVEELVSAYSISEQELEDVIFHNEAYKNSSSSPESTPEKSKKMFISSSPSPQKGSSFVSAVINAIKSAAQSPFALRDLSKDNLYTDHSSSNEMLDSETEPCLMMEHVLEDVVIPDGHSHNLVSSGHGSALSSQLTHSSILKDGLTHSSSLKDLSRHMSEPLGLSLSLYGSLTASYPSDFTSVSLVDQVIEVDNLITRLLKVIRIIQLENEDCMGEVQEERDGLCEQVERQKETNKVVVRQLKDWEVLGARLKTEVKELLAQNGRKNTEMDGLKVELNKQREEVEKLNQDVCELSTALSKAELEHKMKEEEVSEEMKKWEKTGEIPAPEILGRLVSAHNEIPMLKQKLNDKEKHLTELTHEFLASRQVLSESLKDAVNESKKQYDAIDKALEVRKHNTYLRKTNIEYQFNNIALSNDEENNLKIVLVRDLEETSFQSATTMPLITPADFNANAALLQAVANLETAPTINSTA
ncbi:unnamed protein product [Phaedon cochleariae]|uniref:Uncharacterized protein n=1 Tax=Phaedon cochleariae TaxID=80249 RepID=A0A9N9SA47_PHACE|nr:unnamed protein product [Phaedon cochleariae]